MKEVAEKLGKIVSNKPSKWLEQANWRQKNADWLEKSAKIALKILRELRANKLTQKDLATKLDVSPQYVNKIVKGQENLTLETISRIENILGIELISITGYYSSIKMIVNRPPIIKSSPKTSVSSKVEKKSYKPSECNYDPEFNGDNNKLAA